MKFLKKSSQWVLIMCFVVSTGVNSLEAQSPHLGWNSYDCYGSSANSANLWSNLEVFIERLKPYGYEYFVIDANWYRHFDEKTGKLHMSMDKYGRFIPSDKLFPNHFEPIIEHAHKHGIKFGIHLMRGISREAVKKDLPIKGTRYNARDIANVNDTCTWSTTNYGVDMSKPGAQEYYNSIIDLVAGWGVDFIKYDDIVHKPDEINAIADAIEKCDRDIELSISPGHQMTPEHIETYKRADMIRITNDIWDQSEDIRVGFERWEEMQDYAGQGFWLDLDMIPFGHIKVNNPKTDDNPFSKRGYERLDNFSYAQKKTFITQRALAASPLFMGGALPTSPNIVFELITNEDMLECNQNGITGKLELREESWSSDIYIWRVPHRSIPSCGWLGIFNGKEYLDIMKFDKEQLGLDQGTAYELYDIWGKRRIEDAEEFIFDIDGEDVLFIKYQAADQVIRK